MQFQVTMLYRDIGNNPNAAIWEEFHVDCVCTSFVRIEGVTVYTANNNGWKEIQILAKV